MHDGQQQAESASVFVSYRAADTGGAGVAVGLAERLKRDLGPRHVYHAPTDNHLTEDWASTIRTRLERATLVVAVIGPGWERAGAANGVEDPENWARREVVHALTQPGVDLLPVLVDRPGLDPATLPDELAPLATTHGLPNFDLVWDYQDVLMQAWASYHAHEPDVMLVVSDDTASGVVSVAELVAAMQARGEVDTERLRDLSQAITAPPGTAAVPLRTAGADFPDVLVLEPQTVGDHWRRRRAAVEGWVARNPGETIRYGTAGLGVIAAASHAPGLWGTVRRSITRRWRSLHAAGRTAVAVTAAAGVTVGTIAVLPGAWPDPAPVSFLDLDWDVAVPEVLDVDAEAGDDWVPPEGYDLVAVDAQVANPGNDGVGVAADLLRLVDGTDVVAPTVAVDPRNDTSLGAGGFGVQPGEEVDARFLFEVPADTDVGSLAVELGRPDDRPIRFDQDGTHGAVAPVQTTFATTHWDGPYSLNEAVFTVEEATFSLDAGLLPDGSPRPAPDWDDDRRVGPDEVYLLVDMTVLARTVNGMTPGILVGPMRVLADGTASECVVGQASGGTSEVAPADMPVTCPVPIGTEELVFEIGNDGCLGGGCLEWGWASEVDTAALAAFPS